MQASLAVLGFLLGCTRMVAERPLALACRRARSGRELALHACHHHAGEQPAQSARRERRRARAAAARHLGQAACRDAARSGSRQHCCFWRRRCGDEAKTQSQPKIPQIVLQIPFRIAPISANTPMNNSPSISNTSRQVHVAEIGDHRGDANDDAAGDDAVLHRDLLRRGARSRTRRRPRRQAKAARSLSATVLRIPPVPLRFSACWPLNSLSVM